MFSVDTWDGLAKIGKYSVESRSMITPALFPVVDPYKQEIPIKDLETVFKFDQVITSAYLMSKRLADTPVDEYPGIHEYLNFSKLVMMDSGAYQVMLYGDIELGVEDTITLQKQVKPDIGVIMDHPIGYDVPYKEAEKRVHTTLANLQQSIPLFEGTGVNWTLPIQGGRYPDLLNYYLDQVSNQEILDKFNFYALGSVVQVMINQDYSSLVDMIVTTRNKIPVDKPLHLFGAGHPAMFALATFLGCDSYDSAAYILMAKEGRYMTENGTRQVVDLKYLPCSCKVCISYSARELASTDRKERVKKLAEHNLWVSISEINRVRQSIQEGTLWDLVQQRAGAVPNLYRATRRAVKAVTEGVLSAQMNQGTPVSKVGNLRIIRRQDINKPQLVRLREAIDKTLKTKKYNRVVSVAHLLDMSIYNQSTIRFQRLQSEDELMCYILPPLGLVPASLYDIYPLGQMTQELDLADYDFSSILNQIRDVRTTLECDFIIYAREEWKTVFSEFKNGGFEIVYCRNPVKQAIRDIKNQS